MQDWVAVHDDEDDQDDSDETLADWAKLETMRSSHPMHFASKLTEVTFHCKFFICDGLMCKRSGRMQLN